MEKEDNVLYNHLSANEIPDIDLYMDQVIQLFERKYSDTKRSDDEKVLTKTMINNYAKGKLFFPIKNKKYTKEHIMLISLIYQMKNSLSINDIKKTLENINEKIVNENLDLEKVYMSYEQLIQKNVDRFLEDDTQIKSEIRSESKDIEYDEHTQQLLLVASFTHMSNLYKRAAEKIIDGIEQDSSVND